jgi:pimeloyl-ACP methyl ester carboxylesterase
LKNGLRLHYIDEGPEDGEVYLCLHGEPSWSYLYRKMAPVFVAAGKRVVAFDWLGFGRSDKPTDDAVYTFSFHHDTMLEVIDALGLEKVVLVCQDWGGLLGLTLPVDRPALVTKLLIMNTALATGVHPGPGFEQWKAYNATQPDLDVASLMQRGTPGMTDDEAAAYAAPFVDVTYKAGVRTVPNIVPVAPEMDGAAKGKAAAKFWATEWSGPTFMAVGVQDPVLGKPVMKMMQGLIRGCPEPMYVEDGGHFVQERGEAIARAALEAFG